MDCTFLCNLFFLIVPLSKFFLRIFAFLKTKDLWQQKKVRQTRTPR